MSRELLHDSDKTSSRTDSYYQSLTVTNINYVSDEAFQRYLSKIFDGINTRAHMGPKCNVIMSILLEGQKHSRDQRRKH